MPVTLCTVAKRYVVGGRLWYRWIGVGKFLYKCRLSIERSMSLSAAVRPQFAMQVFGEGAGSYRYIASYVSK